MFDIDAIPSFTVSISNMPLPKKRATYLQYTAAKVKKQVLLMSNIPASGALKHTPTLSM